MVCVIHIVKRLSVKVTPGVNNVFVFSVGFSLTLIQIIEQCRWKAVILKVKIFNKECFNPKICENLKFKHYFLYFSIKLILLIAFSMQPRTSSYRTTSILCLPTYFDSQRTSSLLLSHRILWQITSDGKNLNKLWRRPKAGIMNRPYIGYNTRDDLSWNLLTRNEPEDSQRTSSLDPRLQCLFPTTTDIVCVRKEA